MPRTTFVFGADPMKFLGDWGWVVGQESADGGATACIFLLSGACFDESAADSQTRP